MSTARSFGAQRASAQKAERPRRRKRHERRGGTASWAERRRRSSHLGAPGAGDAPSGRVRFLDSQAQGSRRSFGQESDGHARIASLEEETMILEIRAAEGGDDAKMLVLEQYRIYEAVARRHCL